MPILAGEGQFDAIVRLLDILAGSATALAGVEVLPSIRNDAVGAAEVVGMPAGTACTSFLLHNRDVADTLHMAGGGDVADALSQPILPGQTILVPAGFSDTVTISLFAAAGTVPYTITPLGLT